MTAVMNLTQVTTAMKILEREQLAPMNLKHFLITPKRKTILLSLRLPVLIKQALIKKTSTFLKI